MYDSNINTRIILSVDIGEIIYTNIKFNNYCIALDYKKKKKLIVRYKSICPATFI